jgi:hypothetical protein
VKSKLEGDNDSLFRSNINEKIKMENDEKVRLVKRVRIERKIKDEKDKDEKDKDEKDKDEKDKEEDVENKEKKEIVKKKKKTHRKKGEKTRSKKREKAKITEIIDEKSACGIEKEEVIEKEIEEKPFIL